MAQVESGWFVATHLQIQGVWIVIVYADGHQLKMPRIDAHDTNDE